MSDFPTSPIAAMAAASQAVAAQRRASPAGPGVDIAGSRSLLKIGKNVSAEAVEQLADATEQASYHDLMAERPRPNPFERPEAVAAFLARLEKLGITDVGAASQALLERSERLAQDARTAQTAARDSYDAAVRGLYAGTLDVAGFAATVRDVQAWLDHDSQATGVAPAMAGVMQVAQQLRANSVSAFANGATVIYSRLQQVAAAQVALVANLPDPPAGVWGAADPQAEALRTGWGHYWVDATSAATTFAEVHELGGMLRDTPAMASEVLWPPGCPSWAAALYLNWEPAVTAGVQAIRALPPGLRLKKAINSEWRPGLWAGRDHEPPKRGLLEKLGVR
jgi:hypothetical protein